MIRSPLKHTNRNLFHSSNRFYEGVAVTSISSAWMVDEYLVEPSDLAFLEYEEKVVSSYDQLVKSQMIGENVSMDYARSAGVQNEWEMYHFFTQEEVNAPTEVFEYLDNQGNISYFNEEQQKMIQHWDPTTAYPVEDIEGHHIETIRENPTDVSLAADSDNILLATSEAHRTFLHGGNTQNPTTEAYKGIQTTNDEKLEMTLSYNESIMTLNFWEAGAIAIAGTAVVYVTASSIIELIRLRKDPRPWKDKQKDLFVNSFITGITGLGIGAIGYTAHTGIDSLIGDFSIGALESFFGDMLALNGTIFAISLATAGLNYMKLRRQGQSHEQAFRKFKDLALTSVAELAAFSALGIGLEIGVDALGGLLLDALLPDPTGLLIAGRITYSLFKMGKQYMAGKHEEKALVECGILRQEFYYQQALITNMKNNE